MKKTSKKLLSLFLAVVMIVTSCSVGITAFAAEENPTDAYWNNASTADEAFDKLNELVDSYVPMIMGIEIDGKTIGSLLGMSEEEVETATLQKVVLGASPLLLGLLGSSADRDALLKDILVNKKLASAAQPLPKRYKAYFSYLDGTEDDAMSFFDLYQFCKDNAVQDADADTMGGWCYATKQKLDILLNYCIDAEIAYNAEQTEADNAYFAILTQINKVAALKTNVGPTVSAVGEQSVTISYKNQANATVSATGKVDELINNADCKDALQAGIDTCNKALENAGVSLQVTKVSEALLYYYASYTNTGNKKSTTSSPSFAMALNYLKLANDAGEPITTAGLGEASPRAITPSNYDEVLGSLLGSYGDTTNDAAKKYFYYTKMIMSAMMDLTVLDANGWVTTANVRFESFASSKYEAIMESVMTASGSFGDRAAVKKLIEANKFTDEKVAALHDIAVEQGWNGNLEVAKAYMGSEEAKALLGEYLVGYLNTNFFNNNSKKNQASLFCNAIATSVADAKAYKSNYNTDVTASKARNKGTEIPVIQLVNETIAGVIAVKESGATTGVTGYATARFEVAETIKYTGFIKPAIDAAGAKYAYEGNLVIPEKYTVNAVNSALNSTLDGILGMDLVKNAVNGLLESQVDLQVVTHDLWKNLYENPVATIFNLVPLITILLDEVIVPIVFNSGSKENSQYAGFLYSALATGEGILAGKTLDAGDTSIGLTALDFDLNKILPSILYWFTFTSSTDQDVADEYMDKTYDMVGYYKAADYPNANIEAISHGGKDYFIPKFTGIYVADKAIAGVWFNPNLARTIYCAIADEDKENTTFGTNKANKDTEKLAYGLVELITEIVGFAREAVDEYLAEHGNDIRWSAHEKTETQRGLNNILVALPQLLDIMGQKYIEKYGIDSDWTCLYGNKIEKKEKTVGDETVEQYFNNTLQDFKALINDNDAGAVLESFVDILIGNWLNSILDIANDTITGKNKITEKFALVQGLLEALGGFGEKSIITDIFNGLFDLKRSDAASFTLSEQAETGYVGFSTKSGLFLLANLQFDNGKKGIIPLVIGIINGAKTTAVANAIASATKTTTSNSTFAPLASAQFAALGATELLTKENLDASQKLIDKLDAVLKSLLDNTSINDFTLTSNDNILAGALSAVARYIGTTNTNKLIDLVDKYLECLNTKAVNGKVDANKVYTSKNLSKIVIDTYTLIEDIVDYLFYDTTSGILRNGDEYKVVAGAITGIISPDSLSVRMTDAYADTAEILAQHGCWSEIKDTTDLKFAMSNGNKASFYDALGQSLSGIAAIVSAVLAKSYTDTTQTKNYYSELLYPVFNAIATKVGASGVMSPSAFNNATAQDQLIKGVLTPLSNIFTQFYKAPATFLLNVVASLGGILNDKAFKGILDGAVAPINALLGGVKTFIGSEDCLNAPSLEAYLATVIPVLKIDVPYSKNIFVNLINNIEVGDGQKVKDIVKIPNIDWNKLYKADAKTTLLLVFDVVVDTLLKSNLVGDALKGVSKDLYKVVTSLDAATLLQIIGDVLDCFQSPTQAYWTFKYYSPKKDGPISGKFTYPTGVTAQDAEDAVANIDNLVANVFPLLQDLGVADIESLSGLVNDKLYTNEILTTIATALYGAVYDGLILENGLTEIFDKLGLDLSPAGLAAFLTDKSYGNTYSDAAATLKKAKTWGKVKKINWGFKNGSANAQKGFINGLVAMLRPFNNILAVLLAENAGFGELGLTDADIAEVVKAIKGLDISTSFDVAEDSDAGCTLKLKISKGVLTLVIDSKMSNENSTVKCDLAKIVKTLLDQLTDVKVNFGTNGYENAIIPILEAFMCEDVKTYAQYKKDYASAKDNLLLDVLNPIFGLVDDVLEAPIATVTKILPNVAYFLDNNGLTQAIGNLLAPITAENGILGILKENGIDIDAILEAVLGDDLGTIVTDAIGINVKLNLQLNDLANCNIQDIVLPLVKKLLKDNGINITIPDFTFKQLYSHGVLKTVKSAAKNAEGAYTTKRVIARQGEVLVSVLRYVAKVLIKNATALSKLICGIDAIAKNKTLKNIISAIFAQIRTATPDDIVIAIFGILNHSYGQDKFFDYSEFTYKDYEFSFGEMDEDFCRQLAPMLDGLVNGLLADKGGLNGLIGDLLYKDDLISKIATGLYGAVEGVKINDSLNLTSLLAKLEIDFSTENVAALLTDKAYGQTYEANAKVIKNAGKWSKVNASSLHWGVKDRDTFVHALCAVLRPVYGVLDVLLNNGLLNIFDLISIPGSDGYTSTIIPLMEAFGLYNIKTQYQYRQDMEQEYDAILLDILNPLLDKVEDILYAPIEIVADILPNLSLFFANNGLLQLIDNLLTPVSALIDTIKPIADLNKVIGALNLDINGLLGKIGVKADVKIDVYDLKTTLEPLIGAENVVSLLNGIIGSIKIKGNPLGLELPEIDWFQLASHGEYVLNATSQAATIGSRIAVKADQDETLIAVLRYLVNTINYKDNYNKIVNLLGGLLGGLSDSIAGVIDQVLGMLQGDADEVITKLVDLLQSIAG